ncbi:MAG: hypothetical protein KW802_00330 [Candidatus Doudnabacteria bacterium]|nr:hypothetical protein [Candidatus Doudnabacteria bacterium]
MRKYIVVILCLIFTTLFLYTTKSDFPLIFQKDLLAHDESSNSVVAANITRKFFPPMVRVNPLNPEQGNWMEGPYWQHIPPLFAYVPYLFFKLDGQVTIEVKRLSFAFLTWLTGLLFILVVYKYKDSLLAALAASIAAILWIRTPFTHELITGYAFGVSDIVLAFTVVASFGAILWYLREERGERNNYRYRKLILIGLIVALPILAKNLLGAIPAATFLILLLIDHRKLNTKVIAAGISFLSLLVLYYLPLYLVSLATFKSEILVSFLHFKQLEGWGRPWHWYLTNYLPQRYLFRWTWVYYLGQLLSVIFSLKFSILKDRKDKVLFWLAFGWFAWNLLAISLVTSKVPNFIYQTYLLSLFAIVYSIFLFIPIPHLMRDASKVLPKGIIAILIISILITGYEAVRFGQQFQVQRAQAYNYNTDHEKLYRAAEQMRTQGAKQNDLVLVDVFKDDCWARYYILFLTGAESKTLLEMHFGNYPPEAFQKYRNIYFLKSDFTFEKFDTNKLNELLQSKQPEIADEISRVKKDKTSCQWLVPDPVLNAP